MEKVIKDGKVAILYAPGYGAGWTTWNKEHPELMFDPAVVHFLEALTEDNANDIWHKIEEYMILKYPDVYVSISSIQDLEIVWLPVGTHFVIDEHDGNESIQLRDTIKWSVA